MRFVRFGRGGIRVVLCVVVGGEVDERFGEGGCVGVVGNSKGGGSDQVLEGVQGRFVVAVLWCALVCRQEGQNSGDIRASRDDQPVNGTSD